MTTATKSAQASQRLAFDPYVSLRYHFGMLLGVEDLEVEQAYHRGKQWMHTAWLHGEGVVWGLGASFDPDTFELRVEPGLAMDAVGRELYLPYVSCVHLGRWFEEHQDESAFGFADDGDGGVNFSARLFLRFNACLERPVPAISEECSNIASHTAYSRTHELPELVLRPMPDPVTDGGPIPEYHLTRLLFGLDAPQVDDAGAPLPDDQEVLETQAAIAALPAAERPAGRLKALRRFAARDVVAHQPESVGAHLPASLETAVPLADIVVTALSGSTDAGWAVGQVDIDNDIRPCHIATRTIQELLSSGDSATVSSTRLRVARQSLTRTAVDTLVLTTIGEVLSGSDASAVAVSAWNDGTRAWREIGATPALAAATPGPITQVMTIALDEDTADDDLLRVIVKGTGPTPLLGSDHQPLSGAGDGPAASLHEGIDFVHMARASDLDPT